MKFNSGSLILTNTCNLACTYCYTGHTKLKECDKRFMSIETGQKIVDFFIEGAKDNGEDNIYITFFGGEPTLNIKTMKGILEYAETRTTEENLKLKCLLITNGIIFNDELIDFLTYWSGTKAEVMVQISADGGYETQNTNRPLKNGGLSADILVANIKKYQDLAQRLNVPRHNIMLHPVISKATLPDLYNNYLFFRSLGFDGVWTQLVQEDDWTEEDAAIYRDNLMKISEVIIKEYKDGNKNAYDRQTVLSNCFTVHPAKACSAGYSYCSINADGEVYPCHRFAGNKETILGNLDDFDYNSDEKKFYESIFTEDLISSKPCKECKNYGCTKCIAANYENNGSVFMGIQQYCKMVDVETEVKAYLKAEIDKINGKDQSSELYDVQRLLVATQKDQITILNGLENDVKELKNMVIGLINFIITSAEEQDEQ